MSEEGEMSKEEREFVDATFAHIDCVSDNITEVCKELLRRSQHDHSKLHDPERSNFIEYTPKLRNCTYGNDEYKGYLAAMKPALDHHYAENRHHPGHFANGIRDMNLIDIVEMFCDWRAATRRHNDGDIMCSIDINQKRFGYSDELAQIFRNTAKWFKVLDGEATEA